MEPQTAAERIRAAQAALQKGAGSGWADPFLAGLGLQEAVGHLQALAALGPPPRELTAELAAFSRELQRAAAAHEQAAQVHDGLLRTFESSLDLNPGESYGSNGMAPVALSTPGLRLIAEG